ncbi:glycosyltransferase family 1 protein [Aquimarina sp. 2201CG1-2-11]|uniref:glycosyltransferase family 4 protein n=1 Tax=Aquimarina discodermiae TaxID=3231043 RepID=UPI003462232B
MYKVFLETHNIGKMHTGFGQFNYHLLKGLKEVNDPELKYTVHVRPANLLKPDFGNFFKYKHYFGARRYKLTSVRKKYDVWHSLNQNTKIEPYSDLPYVLTIHDVNFIQEISDDLTHERNLRFIEKLKRADAITYISEYAKQSTHQYFEVPNVPEYVIYNGNPLVSFENLEGFSTSVDIQKKYIYAIGDFLERKNFHVLVAMMQHLPDYNLIISGNNTHDYGERVANTITSLGLENQVTLTGRVSEKEKQYYIKNCSAFALPSVREGFGLPAIEAMRFGVPIFLANTTSLPEIGGEHAFYWDDFNPKNMADILQKKLILFKENEKEYSDKLKERADSFSWKKAAQQYIDVYKNVIKNK